MGSSNRPHYTAGLVLARTRGLADRGRRPARAPTNHPITRTHAAPCRTLLGVCLCAVTAASAITLWPMVHSGIVVTHDAPVRVSPVSMEAPLFTLPEATRVRMGKLSTTVSVFAHSDFRADASGWVIQRESRAHRAETLTGGIAARRGLKVAPEKLLLRAIQPAGQRADLTPIGIPLGTVGAV